MCEIVAELTFLYAFRTIAKSCYQLCHVYLKNERQRNSTVALTFILKVALLLALRDVFSKVCRVCPSVCPHGTTPLPLYGFSLNLISDHLS